jgi:hypothetical protein
MGQQYWGIAKGEAFPDEMEFTRNGTAHLNDGIEGLSSLYAPALSFKFKGTSSVGREVGTSKLVISATYDRARIGPL